MRGNVGWASRLPSAEGASSFGRFAARAGETPALRWRRARESGLGINQPWHAPNAPHRLTHQRKILRGNSLVDNHARLRYRMSMKGKSAKLQLTWRLGGNAAKNHTMNRRIQQTGLRVPVLLVSLFLAGCETFRPRDFQPPKDSYEYIMQRDGGSA